VLDYSYCGEFLGGTVETPYKNLGAKNTVSTGYHVLKLIFTEFKDEITKTDVIVDVGCGKGRVINYLLVLGLENKIIGIELNERVAEETRERFKDNSNVHIISGNILENIPEEGTIFYLYNPFNSVITEQFKKKLTKIGKKGEPITIIYHNCAYVELFLEDKNWTVDFLDTPSSLKTSIIRRNVL
ncbi:MAG: methyltransferase domain-containing protein, partial [Atribacterota bacterium]